MRAGKPDYTTSIIQVRANEVIPATLLTGLAKENPSAFGMVIREPDKLVVEKFTRLDSVEKHLTFLTKLEEKVKKYPRMYCFHDFPAEFDEAEVQPYQIIRDSKNNPILVMAVEGDFPDRVNDEFSEAHMLVEDYLGPKIEEMYKLVGNSPSKLFEYLHSVQFQSDFKNVYHERGVMAFMPTVGDPWTIEGANKLGLSSTWGNASNVYGYTESAIVAATPVKDEEKPAPVVKKSKYVDDDEPAPVKAPTIVPPRADPATRPPEEKVAAEIIDEGQSEEIDWKPPVGLHGKALKIQYRAVNNGVLPADWRLRPSVRIRVKTTAKSLAELDQTKVSPNKDMKAIEPKPAENKVLTMPIISGEQQKQAVEFIKKYLGDGSAVIDDPVRANEQEVKLAKFSELVLKSGKLEEIDRWTTAFIFAFVKAHPETAALGFIELRRTAQKQRDLIVASGKTLGDLAGTEAPQVEVQPKPAATPPADAPVVLGQPKAGKVSRYA